MPVDGLDREDALESGRGVGKIPPRYCHSALNKASPAHPVVLGTHPGVEMQAKIPGGGMALWPINMLAFFTACLLKVQIFHLSYLLFFFSKNKLNAFVAKNLNLNYI